MSEWSIASAPPNVPIEQNVSLAPLTTMRVGGPAAYFARVSTLADLSDLLRWAQQVSLPYLVLGGGSNILVSDAGVRGLVIQNRCRQVTVLDALPENSIDQEQQVTQFLLAESGANMAGVARTSVRHGLTGLEWAVSVPGTIGGAVVNNAGAHGGEVKDNLVEAQVVIGTGQHQRYTTETLQYNYRSSVLKSKTHPLRAGFGPVVLSATFQLTKAPEEEVKERADEFLNHRRRTQPVEPSLGSMFMNPPGDYAGRLIEAAGLKGTRIGAIEVSQQHANFIIHPSNVVGAQQESGRATDVVTLIELIQEAVEKQFGIRLQTEVQLVGEWE